MVLSGRWGSFGRWVTFVLLLASVVLHAWSLVLWHDYKDATCETPLPLWLLESGISGYAVFAISLFRRWLLPGSCGYSVLKPTCLVLHGCAFIPWLPHTARCLRDAGSLCSIALFASVVWLIVGSVWSFRISTAALSLCSRSLSRLLALSHRLPEARVRRRRVLLQLLADRRAVVPACVSAHAHARRT